MKNKQEYKEMAGTFAIVGCGDSPNFQVWGARSDLGCKKRAGDVPVMKFGDWVKKREGRKWQKTKAASRTR